MLTVSEIVDEIISKYDMIHKAETESKVSERLCPSCLRHRFGIKMRNGIIHCKGCPSVTHTQFGPIYNGVIPNAQSSEPIPMEKQDTSNEKEQNVVFQDDVPETVLGYGIQFQDSTFTRGYQEGAELGAFLKRPVQILSFVWDVGVTFTSFRFNPWSNFLNNSRVSEKLTTFKLLNATLHIKFMLNGSPFHYGRIFVGMRPTEETNNTVNFLPEDNVLLVNYVDPLGAASFTAQKTFYSQRPHVLLNPSKNIPQEIHWPFMRVTDYIDLREAEPGSDMGYLEIWELNQLRHANGATDSVTVVAYAWLDNVQLTGISPDAQSGPPIKRTPKNKRSNDQKLKLDEYEGTGVVSYPASIVQSISTRLVDVPVIGKFARATAIGANALGSVASLFGFSNPPILDKHNFMAQNQFGRMCQTSGDDTVIKLSFDPKHELTIDPSTVGLNNDDEMAFMNIAQREGLIYTFPWQTITANNVGHLFGCVVNPTVAPVSALNATPLVANHYWHTPVGGISVPFRFWTGSLVYRIQVVCSQMHRGRLGIVYSPTRDAVLLTTTYDTLEHFHYIMDISKETDCSFEIKWAQPVAWADVVLPSTLNADVCQGTNLAIGNTEFNNNGRLDIYVVTELGAPITDSTVEVNVYLSAGDSFRLANPIDNMATYAFSEAGGTFDLGDVLPAAQCNDPIPFVQASGPMSLDSAYATNICEDDPDHCDSYVLNGTTSGSDDSSLLNVYMGEDIRSIRALIKRYQGYYCMTDWGETPNAVGDVVCATVTLQNFPIGRSGGIYGSSGITELGDGNVWMTYLRWFAQGYVGFRGSVRYKVYTTHAFPISQGLKVNRDKSYKRGIAIVRTAYGGAGNNIGLTHFLMGSGALDYPASDRLTLNGVMVQPNISANCLQYELPWYHFSRYGEIHRAVGGIFLKPTPNTGMYQNHSIQTEYIAESTNNAAYRHFYTRHYVAGGEDSAFFFFIGIPAHYIQAPHTL
jgi:hypothetical protein